MTEETNANLHQNVEGNQSLESALNEKATEEAEIVSAEGVEEVSEEKPEQKDEFASKFAALSRKEKALRQREQELESKLAEMEERLKAQEPKEEPKEPELPLEYRLKANPLKTLEELGMPYDKLTQLVLNDGKLPPEMQLELVKQDLDSKYSKEIEELRNQIQEREKQQEEARYQETIESFKHELNNFVKDNTEKYELISANDATDLVFEVIEDHYNDTGRILSNEEAADAVEEYLLEEAKKLAESKKLKSLFGAAEAKPEVQERKSQPTLSNNLSSQGVSPKSERFLSDDESKALAANLLKWDD